MDNMTITLTILAAFTVITDLLIRGTNSKFYTGRKLTNVEAAAALRDMQTVI